MNKNETITKKYFIENTKNFVTKDYLDKTLEAQTVRLEQFMTDLTTGFVEQVKGVCDQVQSLDEKITRIDQRVAGIDHKLTNIDMNVFHIKGVLKEKTSKKEHLMLKKRVLNLEI